jgi:hypothetical protein
MLDTEFKEIRKEWKQKKKEEEAARKAADERAAAERANAPEGLSRLSMYNGRPPTSIVPPMGGPQLPPIGYGGPPSSGPPPPGGYGAPSPAIDGMQ